MHSRHAVSICVSFLELKSQPQLGKNMRLLGKTTPTRYQGIRSFQHGDGVVSRDLYGMRQRQNGKKMLSKDITELSIFFG